MSPWNGTPRTELVHYVVTCTEGHWGKRELTAAQACGIAGECWCGRALFVPLV